MTETAVEKPRRHRRLAISLRGALLLTLIVGGGLGWMIHRARVQRIAVERIKKAGGNVAYDWESQNGQPIQWDWQNDQMFTDSKPPWPKWVVDLTGPDFLSNVTVVLFVGCGSAAGDDLMTDVARLHRLEYLSLISTPVTDAGVAKIRGLTRLKTLNLDPTRVTGAGLAHLEKMVDLEELTFPQATVTDDDLAHLAGLTKLKKLTLEGSRVTDVGMMSLRDMRRLEYLDIQNTKVTDLGPIRHLTQLYYLNAEDCPIDDAGAAPIAHFRDLKYLDLGGSRITDDSVAAFSDLPKLASLSLTRTSITDVGLGKAVRSGSLKVLDLYDTQTTDAGMLGLAMTPFTGTPRQLVVCAPRQDWVGVLGLRGCNASLRGSDLEIYAQNVSVRDRRNNLPPTRQRTQPTHP